MASLGSFGRRVEASEPDTFEYFGEVIRVSPLFGEVALMDWIEQATSIDEESSQAVVAIKNLLRQVVEADDFDVFWRLARENAQGTEDLMLVVQAVTEAAGKRPTERSSSSQDGPQSTAPNSPAGSYSRAMARLDGRPDLQIAVVRAQEARSA